MEAKSYQREIRTRKPKLLLAGVILAVLVLVIGLGAYAASSDDSCGNHLTWSYDSDTTTLTISGYGDMYDYGSSSSTAAPWYSYRKEITKVVIDCTSTSSGIGIGDYAFYSCSAIETLTGDESITEIGSYALYNCSSLAGLDISGVTVLGDHAFYGNDSMTEATVNAAITEIPEFLFQGCDSLEKVVLLGDVTGIGSGAFYNCVMLDTLVYSASDTTENIVYIADTVETIGTQAFYGCVSYDDDNEPAGGISTVVFMGDSVEFDTATKKTEAQFYNCAYLSSITLPSAQTEIAPYLLSGCTALKTVSIPETVTTIGKYAFSDAGLTSVTIPASVTELGSNTFANDSSLSEVTFADGINLTEIAAYTFSQTALEEITIPDSVSSIGENVFKNCTALTNVIFGTGLTSLGSNVFYGCTSEMELHFTGEYTYTDTDGNETEITISDTAFNGISAIGYYPADSETWPAGTAVSEGETYGATAFIWAKEGEEVELVDWYTIDESTGTLYIYLNGDMMNYSQTSTPWYSKRASIQNIVFGVNPDDPDTTYTLTSIGNYAFYGFSALESVTIPASVTSIGKYAFYGSEVTQSTTVGGGGTTYSNKTVSDGLEQVAFEEGSVLEEIGAYAFGECGNLNDIVLPDSLEEIGDYAFYQCGSVGSYAYLTYTIGSDDYSGASMVMTMNGSASTISEIKLDAQTLTEGTDYTIEETDPDAANTVYVTISFTEDYLSGLSAGVYTGSLMYSDSTLTFTLYVYAADSTEEQVEATGEVVDVVTGLASIDLSNVKSIGEGVFYNCFILEDVTTGSSLETIGDKAFYNCENVTALDLPDSLQTLGSYAFYGTGLQQVELPAGVHVCSYAFSGCTSLSSVTFSETDGNGSVLTLDSYAFDGCSFLTEMTLPDEITVINDGLFNDCSGLQTVEFKGSVTSVGDSAFSGCSALESVTGLSSATSVGDYAFENCAALTSPGLSESLTNDQVGDFAFYKCTGLADENGFVVLNGVLYSYVYSVLGIEAGNVSMALGTDQEDEEIENVTIPIVTVPEEVTEIANYAFYQMYDTAGGTSSAISMVTLEGLEFTCAADDITFEEYAFAGLPLLAEYDGYTATIVYPCDDADAWIAKFDSFGLTGTGEAFGYRYSTSWSLELEIGHVQGDDAVTVEPTCTEDGSLTYTCTRCGETVVEVLDATGHSYDTYKVTKEATCTEEGEITYTCTVCGETLTEATEALGHTLGEGKVTTEPTCTEEGVMTYKCTVCGEEVTEAIEATGHSYDEGTVTTEPTCTEEGVRTYTCTVCGETYTEPQAALSETGEHDYTIEETVEATCTEDGSVTYTCYVCGDAYTEVITATGHTWNEGEVTTEPTCTDEGVMTYTCTVCGETYTETIAALSETGEHTWDGDVCSVCGATKAADTSGTASGTASGTTTDTASGTTSGSTSVQKKTQTLKIKAVKKKTVSCKKLKKKKQTVRVIKKVTGAKTKVTYKKVSGKKCLKVNKKTGKVTIKKGTKKGTYKIKIKVSAKKTAAYEAASKTVTVRIKVK